MGFAGKVWRLLVGIKDGLVLLFMLLFFMALYAILTARPSPAEVRDGALLLSLDGFIVEEKAVVDPLSLLLSGQQPIGEYAARDLVHALDQAATDDRINSVVLDLSSFLGAGQVHLGEIGAALDRVKAAEKPVFAFATAYMDDSMYLAAHATEVWADPLGGAIIAGPGGERLYYAGLIDRLNVNAKVYRVGTYKAAVEPFSRSSMSDAARENYQALYGALWEEWQASVKKARPALQLDRVTNTPAQWVADSDGDLATAAMDAGLVDTLGSWEEFGARVAEIAGENSWDESPGAFAATDLDPWLADNPRDVTDQPIGVITIAGEIVDGEAGPGSAGGARIAGLLDDALQQDLAGLVIRVDSPGGSVLASEQIRRAVMRHKERDIPIAVSMANVAASGGYWVATPADRIFAEPESITGSIGIFAIVPTFEDALADYGVQSDGVRTTPLSGQPDVISGFTPEVDAILQSTIEDGYNDFLTRVAEARNLTTAQVDTIGQGRVWDGGTARQIGLIDQYGGLDTALEWVASQAELEAGDWHAAFLGSDIPNYDNLLRTLLFGGSDARTPGTPGPDIFTMMAAREGALLGRLSGDLDRFMAQRGMQAYCLECPAQPHRVAQDGALATQAPWWKVMAGQLLR